MNHLFDVIFNNKITKLICLLKIILSPLNPLLFLILPFGGAVVGEDGPSVNTEAEALRLLTCESFVCIDNPASVPTFRML